MLWKPPWIIPPGTPQWASRGVSTQVGGPVGGGWAVMWGSDRAGGRGFSVGWGLRGTRISGGTGGWLPVGRGPQSWHALLFGEPVGGGNVVLLQTAARWHLWGRWRFWDVVPIVTRPVVIRVAINIRNSFNSDPPKFKCSNGVLANKSKIPPKIKLLKGKMAYFGK